MVTPLPPDLDRPRGGVEAVSICLIPSLIKLGVRITVIQRGGQEEGLHGHPDLACDVIPLRLRHPAVITNWLITPRELNEIVEDVAPDVVHVQDIPEFGTALRRPRVLTIHGNNPVDEWLNGGLRRYLTVPIMSLTFSRAVRTYDHIIMISPYSREVVRFASRTRLYDIDNPIEDRFFAVERKASAPTVLAIGLLSRLKNTMAIVRAAARLRRDIPGVRFRIAGPWRGKDPACRRSVEEFCRREGLDQTVRFLGPIGREQVLVELANAACLVLPSFQENAPMVVAEAMAAGVPVAASRVGALARMVEDGKTGFLFDPYRLDEMVDSLNTLLTDHDLRQAMGQAAHEVAARRYRAEAVAKRTLEVYNKAIEERDR